MAGNITTQAHSVLLGMDARPGGLSSETLTGALTMDWTYGSRVLLDPGGATRVVTLPDASGGGHEGVEMWIRNTADADEDLTINDVSGNVNTLGQNQNCVYIVVSGGWISFSGLMTWA